MEHLRQQLRRIDGSGYPAYKGIRGEYSFGFMRLFVDHVQGDPFAAPSRIAVVVDAEHAQLEERLIATRSRRIASEDFFTRSLARTLASRSKRSESSSQRRGSGKSGRIEIDRPGQEVLERTSCLIDNGGIEVRLTVGLPAAGRRVLGKDAERLLCDELPSLIERTLLPDARALDSMMHHADTVEDQDDLRDRLAELGWIAFIADGCVLPRRSGVDDRPLEVGAVGFGPAPESLAATVDFTHAGPVRGLAIKEGVTLLVGGGYHGKSTVLEAIARGIYSHIPDDGRERCVARTDAVTIRAEDGRRIEGVGIDGFIGPLPGGSDTRCFSTDRASGSTSQAAAVMEAVEAGAGVLLMDEDRSAANFLARDHRMQRLVANRDEPIRPFVDRVQTLASSGVSTVLVMGGSSAYFEVADHVIRMADYRPLDVTGEVATLVASDPTRRQPVDDTTLTVRRRAVLTGSASPTTRRGRERAQGLGTRAIRYGDEEIDIGALDQLVDDSQTRAIADALVTFDQKRSVSISELSSTLATLIGTRGLCAFAVRGRGDRAAVRSLDVIAALNRLRTLTVRQLEKP
ncbi:MAG: putative ABC-class ATPase [Myxococcota bacterium]|jgi:predicted ABC-class ATPase